MSLACLNVLLTVSFFLVVVLIGDIMTDQKA